MALGRILSQSLRREERWVRPKPPAPAAAFSKNLNRLLCAAVVSPRFCELLLSNPAAALAAGYNGESFQLTPAEYAAVTSLRADNVCDLAAQLLRKCQSATGETTHYAAETPTEFRFIGIGAR